MRNVQKRSNKSMSFSLFNHAVASIYKDNSSIGRGCSGDHVSGVLNVTGCIGNNELSFGGCKIPICHINCNSLLPLIAKPVSKQRQIHPIVSLFSTGSSNGLQLILKYRL